MEDDKTWKMTKHGKQENPKWQNEQNGNCHYDNGSDQFQIAIAVHNGKTPRMAETNNERNTISCLQVEQDLSFHRSRDTGGSGKNKDGAIEDTKQTIRWVRTCGSADD